MIVLLVSVIVVHAQFIDYDLLAGDYGLRKLSRKLQRSTGYSSPSTGTNYNNQGQQQVAAGYQQGPQQQVTESYQKPAQPANQAAYNTNNNNYANTATNSLTNGAGASSSYQSANTNQNANYGNNGAQASSYDTSVIYSIDDNVIELIRIDSCFKLTIINAAKRNAV